MNVTAIVINKGQEDTWLFQCCSIDGDQIVLLIDGEPIKPLEYTEHIACTDEKYTREQLLVKSTLFLNAPWAQRYTESVLEALDCCALYCMGLLPIKRGPINVRIDYDNALLTVEYKSTVAVCNSKEWLNFRDFPRVFLHTLL